MWRGAGGTWVPIFQSWAGQSFPTHTWGGLCQGGAWGLTVSQCLSHVPRTSASPGEPWRLPSPRTCNSSLGSGGGAPTFPATKSSDPGGALIHVPKAHRRVPAEGGAVPISHGPSLAPQASDQVTHLPLLPACPILEGLVGGTSKEQGHSFHDDALSQDSHTQWDGDVSGIGAPCVCPESTPSRPQRATLAGTGRAGQADGHPETQRLQQHLCPDLWGCW